MFYPRDHSKDRDQIEPDNPLLSSSKEMISFQSRKWKASVIGGITYLTLDNN